jgi:hypothetical protein
VKRKLWSVDEERKYFTAEKNMLQTIDELKVSNVVKYSLSPELIRSDTPASEKSDVFSLS